MLPNPLADASDLPTVVAVRDLAITSECFDTASCKSWLDGNGYSGSYDYVEFIPADDRLDELGRYVTDTGALASTW